MAFARSTRKSLLVAASLLCTVGAIAPAHAATVFESAPAHTSNGFADYRGAGSTAVGRLTVSDSTVVNGIGVLNYLTSATNLKFFIADATTGALLYLSGAQAFGANTGAVNVANLTYKDSSAFSFTLNRGVTYAIGSIADKETYTFADGSQTNTSGVFTSLLGNVNVSDFADPTLSTYQACCSIGFRLDATPAVPEPATWGMMLAGLGVVGFALRRKSQVTARVRFA